MIKPPFEKTVVILRDTRKNFLATLTCVCVCVCVCVQNQASERFKHFKSSFFITHFLSLFYSPDFTFKRKNFICQDLFFKIFFKSEKGVWRSSSTS